MTVFQVTYHVSAHNAHHISIEMVNLHRLRLIVHFTSSRNGHFQIHILEKF